MTGMMLRGGVLAEAGVLLDRITGRPQDNARAEAIRRVKLNLAHAGVLRFLGLAQPEMFDAHANFAYSTVATAPSPASSGTSLVVASGDGSKFPAASFNAVVWPSGAQPLASNAEIVRVTAISTDTFTITRAQESSSARSITVGDQIAAVITKKTITDIENAPSWQDFTPSLQGCSGTPTINVARYCQIGKLVVVVFNMQGTSNQTYKTFTLPVAMAANAAEANTVQPVAARDNGTFQTVAGVFNPGFDMHAAANSTTVCSIYKTIAFGTWTASGTWQAQGEFFYEAA